MNILAGVPADFPPQYSIDTKTGQPVGFAIDIMDEVAKRSGLKVRYKVFDTWPEAMKALKEKRIHLIPNVGIIDERKNYCDFTIPVETFHISIFRRNSTTDIQDVSDLTGRVVAVVKSNKGLFIMKKQEGVKLQIHDSLEQALLSLLSGNADAFVYPEPPVQQIIRRSGVENHIKIVGKPLMEIKRGIAVQKGLIILQKKINDVIMDFVGTPEYEKIYTKWYGKQKPFWNITRVIIAMGILLVLTILCLMVWRYFSIIHLNKALKESEKRQRKLFDEAIDGIGLVELETGIIVDCNKALSELVGRKKSELIGKSQKILHPSTNDNEESTDTFQQHITDKEGHILENIIVTKSGKVRDVEIKASILELEKNKFLLKIFRDVTERKQAENALHESEKRYKSLFKNNHSIMLLIDPENADIVDANPAAISYYGWSHEEITEKKITDINILTEKKVFQEMERAKKEQRQHFFFSHRLSNREIRDVEVYSGPISIFGKKLLYSIVHDITDRKLAEDALQKSEEKFRSAFHTSPDSINLNSIEDGVYLDINDGFTKTMGYTREDVIGKSSIDFDIWNDPKDRERLAEGLKKHGLVENLEANFIGKDGRIRTGLMSARILSIANKDIILSITRDITEKRKAEEALKESEEKYRSMMEAMNDAAYICSSDFRVEYMNPAMIKRQGTDATGKLCHKVIHGLYEKCPWCIFEKVIKGDSINYEIVSPKDDKTFHISSSPIYHTDGSVSKLTIFRDVTEFKRLETQLQKAQRMEAIGTLAGGIAHDFNNILFPIVGHTEMLLEDVPEGSPFRDSLKGIYTGALRAKELVKQILTFSRQNTNEFKLMKMQPIIEEAMKLIRSSIPTTIEIKQNIQSECGAIKADPTQIHQIVMNLATNAYHAMKNTGGELIVGLKEIKLGELDRNNPDMTPGVYACLTMADTGKGMDKDLIEKIFDPFFTTKEQGKGTGMGLSVVHGIVKSTGGAIQVYSEPGKGTEFKVYLPMVKSSYEQQKKYQIKEPIQSGTEQILLVDDEVAIITMEKLMLERLGYQVTSRTSSIEALEAFRDSPYEFDLVITDMAMPHMSGDKLAVELTKIRSDIPILLCTGFSENMSDDEAAFLGIKGFLLKPIVMKDLARKIREVLDDR